MSVPLYAYNGAYFYGNLQSEIMFEPFFSPFLSLKWRCELIICTTYSKEIEAHSILFLIFLFPLLKISNRIKFLRIRQLDDVKSKFSWLLVPNLEN